MLRRLLQNHKIYACYLWLLVEIAVTTAIDDLVKIRSCSQNGVNKQMNDMWCTLNGFSQSIFVRTVKSFWRFQPHVLSSVRNSGPFHQTSHSTNSFPLKPQDGIPAGLSLPGPNLHSSFDVTRKISSTQCRKYCFQTLLLFIQNNVIGESTQYTVSISFAEGRDSLTIFTSRARMVAPKGSNLGMVCSFTGITLLFDAIS